jgi:Trypsin-like peptidase domain
MRKLLLYCLLLACWNLWGAKSQAQVVPGNVSSWVLMIRVGDQVGTAFTMDVDGRRYLVTAKHMVNNLKDEGSIDIFARGQWSGMNVKVFSCDPPIDIAVLIPRELLTHASPLETGGSVFISQDAYFLGFPFGSSVPAEDINGLNGPYPLAFFKKGIVSAVVRENGVTKILLDGYNNPGFSGGPIVFHDWGQPGYMFRLLGVISGFCPDLVHVTTPEKIKPGQDISHVDQWRIVKLKNGQTVELKDTEEEVPLNSGIVLGYGIEHAEALIRKHPIGPKVAN